MAFCWFYIHIPEEDHILSKNKIFEQKYSLQHIQLYLLKEIINKTDDSNVI